MLKVDLKREEGLPKRSRYIKKPSEICLRFGCPADGVSLQVPSSQMKQRNQTIELSSGLYYLVVLFLLLYVICASARTEETDICVKLPRCRHFTEV